MLWLLFRVALFVFGCAFLLHFGKDLPERYREIARSRARARDALSDPKKDAVVLREEYQGDLVAFAVVCGITVIVAMYVLGVALAVVRMFIQGW